MEAGRHPLVASWPVPVGRKTPHARTYLEEETQRKQSVSTLINFDSPAADWEQSSLWSLPPPSFIQSSELGAQPGPLVTIIF